LEPLALDGSNYASWSIHVFNFIRTIRTLAEKVVTASILPPHLGENKIYLSRSSLKDLEQWQCISRVFNYIYSTLSDDVHEFIYEKINIDAYTIWEILREEYEKPKWIDQEQTMKKALEECSKSSFNNIEPQVSLPEQGDLKKRRPYPSAGTGQTGVHDRSDRCR
jgi:hypothetical protein